MNVAKKKKKNFIHENPFICAVCHKAFARKVGLTSHLKKTNHSIAKQWPQFLQTVLPQEWPYNVTSFCENENNYKVKLVLPSVTSVDVLRSWINRFISLSRCVYIRVSGIKNRTCLTPHCEIYRCQHFHRLNRDKKRSKGTGCKSSITASIKCDFGANPYYGAVSINFFHNHPVYSGDTLKFRQPSADVENIFHRMFQDGFSPAHALRNFMTHLEFQPADVYVNSISNRMKCPDYNWVHHFFGKLLKKPHTAMSKDENLQSIKKFVENINGEFNNEVCCFQDLMNLDYVLSILTPLMKRGLKNLVAGEMIFVDSVDCIDRFGLNIFLLSCVFNSTTRIPLGIIITTQQTTTFMEQGFGLYLSMTDGTSFGGRGKDGPAVIMSDHSKIIVRALKTVFPKAALLWFSSYFLKSAYNWMLNSKYHVNKDDLGQLYSAVRKLVYSPDENDLENNYRETLLVYSSNPHLVNYLKTLHKKRHKWALCFRSHALKKNIEPTKELEHEVQILKEEILDRVKLQSPDVLLRYFVSDYDGYYMKKLIDNCVDLNQNYFNKFVNDIDVKNYTFGPFLDSDCLYYVYNKHKKTKYIVNVDTGMCTCYIGVSGNFCRHQRILMDSTNEESLLQYPMIVEPKVELYYIATGSREISQTFFDSVHSFITAETDIQYAMEVVLRNDDGSDSSCVDDIEENLDTHVVEEILIEVNDDDDVCDQEEESQYTETTLTSTSENPFDPGKKSQGLESSLSLINKYAESIPKNDAFLTNNLENNFREFVTIMRENSEYYEPGIQAMLNELKMLNGGSPFDRLLALKSFNKHSRGCVPSVENS